MKKRLQNPCKAWLPKRLIRDATAAPFNCTISRRFPQVGGGYRWSDVMARAKGQQSERTPQNESRAGASFRCLPSHPARRQRLSSSRSAYHGWQDGFKERSRIQQPVLIPVP